MKSNKPSARKIPADTIVTLITLTHNDVDIILGSLLEINKLLKTLKTTYEIIVIDNNSDDDTVKEIRKAQTKIPYIRILKLSKEYDTEIALTAGLDNSIGDYSILFNIYTDPIEIIETVFEKLLDNFDLVIGKPKKDIIKTGFAGKLFLHSVEQVSTHGFSYRQNFLTGFSRKALNSIIRTRRKSRNFSYLNNLIGFSKTTVEYAPEVKFKKKIKKENSLQLFKNVINIILSNSFRPIRILCFMGMLFSLFFFLYVMAITVSDIFLKTSFAPKGWISVSAVLSTLFFLLFTLLTIMSEYLVRILSETRDEPLYYIADEIDKSVILDRTKLNVI